MSAPDDTPESARDVLRPLPRAAADGSRQVGLFAASARPGRTGARAVDRARLVGRSESVRNAAARDGALRDWLARPRWADVAATPTRTRFEVPITGDPGYDALIRMFRRRKNPQRAKPTSPGPGLPRVMSRRGTRAGGATGPGEVGRRLQSHPVQPEPTAAVPGPHAQLADAAPSCASTRPRAEVALVRLPATVTRPGHRRAGSDVAPTAGGDAGAAGGGGGLAVAAAPAERFGRPCRGLGPRRTCPRSVVARRRRCRR